MKLAFRLLPIVRRADNQRRLDVEVELAHGLGPAELVLIFPCGSTGSFPFSGGAGRTRITTWFPEPESTVSVAIELRAGGQIHTRTEMMAAPCRPWRVHLLHQSHFDYGYTSVMPDILRLQLSNFDTALDYIARASAEDEADRFRWNVECTFPLLKYLDSRPASCLERLLEADRAGLLEVAAMPYTLHSEGCMAEELMRALEPVRKLRELGFTIRTAVQSDVPGVSALLPRLLNDIGIRHLSMAPNNFRAPFHREALKHLPRPFLWQGPSGGELFTWFSDLYDHVYQEGNILGFTESLETVEARMGERLASLEAGGFAGQTLGLRTQGSYSDNGRPNFRIAEIVKEWNAIYSAPQIRMSTFHQFFAEIEAETSSSLETRQGFWPDWWAEGIGSMAREFALHRRSQERLQFSQTALALATGGSAHYAQALEHAWDHVMMCDEHTWGAAAPADNDERGHRSGELQTHYKRSFFFQGALAAEQLENSARANWALAGPIRDRPVLAVQNSLSWARGGIVEIPREELEALVPGATSWRFLDEKTGRTVPWQSRTSGEVNFVDLHVDEVGAFGQRLIFVEADTSPEPNFEVPSACRDLWRGKLSNAHMHLVFCQKTGGLLHWQLASTGETLIQLSPSFLFGSVIRQSFSRRHIYFIDQELLATETEHEALLIRVEDGPLWSRLLISTECGRMKVNRAITLHHTTRRVDIATTLHKPADVQPEAIFMALPFEIPSAQCILGTNAGPMRPGHDQIPGSSSDWFVLRDHLDVAGPEGGVMVALPDTPMIQLGDIRQASPRGTSSDASELFVYVQNNLWPTNFAPSQGGQFTFNASFVPYSHAYDPAWSRRRAAECVTPLRVMTLTPGAGENRPQNPIQVEASDNIIATLRPWADGIEIRIEETANRRGSIRLQFPHWRVDKITRVNAAGEFISNLPAHSIDCLLSPGELVTLRLDIESAALRN